MPSNLKLVVNNPHKQKEERQFFERDELKIILDLYAKMVSVYPKKCETKKRSAFISFTG